MSLAINEQLIFKEENVDHDVTSTLELNNTGNSWVLYLGSFLQPEEIFKCNICKKILENDEKLKQHTFFCKSEKKFECKTCGAKYRRRFGLLVHRKAKHLNIQGNHQCEICSKKFHYKLSLQTHIMVIHEKRRPFACEICKLTFTTKYFLADHVRSLHTGEKPYVCNICKKAFSVLNSLTRHKNTHQKQEISCHLCGSMLKSKAYILVHMKRHRGEKSHKCEICQATFVTKREIQIHLLSHTKEKPYFCDLCDKRYSSKENLNKHKKNIHSHSEETTQIIQQSMLSPQTTRIITADVIHEDTEITANVDWEENGIDANQTIKTEIL